MTVRDLAINLLMIRMANLSLQGLEPAQSNQDSMGQATMPRGIPDE